MRHLSLLSRLFILSLAVLVTACPGPSATSTTSLIASVTADTMLVKACLSSSANEERRLDSATINFARANGYNGWCIPEYDDDQRWQDGAGGNEYGSVAHVFAAPYLNLLTSHTNFDAAYVNVAILDVDPPYDPTTLPPYHELNLQEHNCIYLKHHDEVVKHYFTALIVPPNSSNLCPTDPPEPPGGPLDVAMENNGSNFNDYPPVTRFIEGNGNRTWIGVKCTDRQCIIGKKSNLGSIPPTAQSGIAALESPPQGRVKGWFDDQVLGVPDGTPQFNIHRRIRASLIPDTLLASLHVTPHFTAGYQLVGFAYFKDDPKGTKYETTFGFTKGTNTVWLRAVITPKPSGADTTWYAQVKDQSGTVTKTDLATKRMDHHQFVTSVPATARWRWADGDEDLWFECDVGCCLITGVRG